MRDLEKEAKEFIKKYNQAKKRTRKPASVIGNLIWFFIIAFFLFNLSGGVIIWENIFNKMGIIITLAVILGFWVLIGFRVIDQYEKAIVLTFGKYTSTRMPGLRWILVGVQRMTKLDLRVRVVDVPDQDCMTKDNVSVNVNAVLYYFISHAEKAFLQVEDYIHAVSQLAQTTMRDVVGEYTLDELLAQRDKVSNRIQELVDFASDPWGIKVQSVDLKHIELPDDMKRTMGKEAEAEREKRAVIIKAEGEKVASQNLADAASILSSQHGALHLRTLHSLNDLSSDQSNTVVLGLPLEILRAFERMGIKPDNS